MTLGSPKKVLLTGGLGFIGTHVADQLIGKNCQVDLLDSMVAAVTDGEDYEVYPGIRVIRQSVQDWFRAGNTVEDYDLVVHAASLVGPAGILKHAGRLGPEMIEAANLVLDSCRATKTPVVLFSSAEIYGRSGDLAESDDIIVPMPYSVRIEYALAKTLIEAMAVNSRSAGVPVIVIRPFNVTGPRQSRANGFVMPTFVQQALTGQPITVFDSGEQTRAFLSATDLARFIAEHLEAAFASDHVIFNLGNPENKISIMGLAERIKQITQSHSPVERVDARIVHGDLYTEAASRDKIPVLKNALDVGWRPQIGLGKLIDETIEHYQTHCDALFDASA